MTQLAFFTCTSTTLLPSIRKHTSISRWRCTASTQRVSEVSTRPILVEGGVIAARGFRAGGVTAGLKLSGAADLAVVIADNGPTTTGAVFTRSQVRAAPVLLSERHLRESGCASCAVVINSGQANAATGEAGMSDASQTASVAANLLGCDASNVLLCSTGMIGMRFDKELLCAALPGALRDASATVAGATAAARAIMTTDLRLKEIAYEVEIMGKIVRVGGMCKGSGMIHPDMATMLGVVTCDADVKADVWQDIVSRAVDRSFNSITVDGDSSTNDTVFALASGASGLSVRDGDSRAATEVEDLVTKCMIELAKQVARDGEGANVLVEVHVNGAATDADCRLIARTIAGSSLNKAAIFGCDPNWGRIAAAAGRAGVMFDATQMDINIGPFTLMRQGQPLDFDAKAASAYLKQKANASPERYLTEDDTVLIDVCVGKGIGKGVAWGCDLSYKYVEINAEYST